LRHKKYINSDGKKIPPIPTKRPITSHVLMSLYEIEEL